MQERAAARQRRGDGLRRMKVACRVGEDEIGRQGTGLGQDGKGPRMLYLGSSLQRRSRQQPAGVG